MIQEAKLELLHGNVTKLQCKRILHFILSCLMCQHKYPLIPKYVKRAGVKKL